METKNKKTLSEMTLDELLVARQIVVVRKEEFVKVQNFDSAKETREKQVRIEVEMLRRLDEMFDI